MTTRWERCARNVVAHELLPGGSQVRRTPPETNLESVPRDAPVKADSIPDRASTNARLSQGLHRVYNVPEGQPDRLGQLVELLHRYLSGERS